MTVSREVTIVNPLGFHMRPAALFVRMASTFTAEIEVAKDSLAVNGKSIMGVRMLQAEAGSTITIRADGSDAEVAVEALSKLVVDGFGET